MMSKIFLKNIKYPLAAPSANISSRISPVTKEDVIDEFGNKIKFVLNGGRSKVGLESTIVSLVNKVQILRLGGVEIKKINKTLNTNIKFNKKNKLSKLQNDNVIDKNVSNYLSGYFGLIKIVGLNIFKKLEQENNWSKFLKSLSDIEK